MKKIEIIPAIDIIDGKCVRLTRGDYNRQTTYAVTPADMARRYADIGVTRLHVVDLDGARSAAPVNLRALEAIAAVPGIAVEWGGGIKTAGALMSVFDAGATYAVVGSVAARMPELMQQWLSDFGGDRIVLSADVAAGKIAVNGWQETEEMGISVLVDRFRPFGLRRCIVTEISCDGMLQGPATDLYVDLQGRYDDVDFTVSGGVASIDDIIALNDAGLRSVIIGKAIYENHIPLSFIKKWLQNA